jgi:hypothetical protein
VRELKVHLFVAGVILPLLSACGGHHPSEDDSADLPRECVEFVQSYERYVAASAPQEIARGRARQTEASLRRLARTQDPSELAATCRSNVNSIPASAVVPGATK